MKEELLRIREIGQQIAELSKESKALRKAVAEQCGSPTAESPVRFAMLDQADSINLKLKDGA